MKRTITTVCTLTLLSLLASGAKEISDEIHPDFVSSDISIPKGNVLFIGFDRGEKGMIVLREIIPIADRTNRPASGVHVVESVTAESDLTLNVSAWAPPDPEDEKSMGKFKFELSWNNDRKETNQFGNVVTWYDGGGGGGGHHWQLAGSLKHSEAEDANGKWRDQWQWHPHETPIPMRMEKVNTNVKSLTYYRIPCASTENGTKALVIFIGDNVETISKHIRVSRRQHSFRWDRSSFLSQGKPYLQPVK